jgi:RNA polymerase sigma factor (sigma-70 family)
MSKKTLSDEDILLAIYSGQNEDKALEFLYSKLLPKVKRISKKYKANDIDSYDVFQESIVKLYDYVKLRKFNDKYSIESFVLTIAKNRILDNLRKKTRRQEVEIKEHDIPKTLEANSDFLVTEEKRKAMEQVFATIGDRCKELLLLSVFDRRSMAEICKILDFSSENSAKTQKYKCKQKLIKSLEKNPNLAKIVLSHV